MYELNGIVYADNPTPLKTIKYARPLDNYKLLLRFSNGDEREVDISALLNEPAFRPLQDKNVFQSVYVDYGTVVWCNGTIDIAPEYLYNISVQHKPSPENGKEQATPLTDSLLGILAHVGDISSEEVRRERLGKYL